MKKTVLIYRDALLPYSETFIPAQVENFSSYQGFYIGSGRFKGLRCPLPPERTLVLSDQAKVTTNRRFFYLLTGWGYGNWSERLKALSPCLIHTHFATDGIWALPLMSRLKIPLILTCHGHDVTSSNRTNDDLVWLYGEGIWPPVYRNFQKKLFRQAHTCIAVSNFIRSRCIELGCPENKVIVQYIGVDVDHFLPEASICREPIVLFVGRLVKYKGCDDLIRAMAEVQSVMPELELVIIGDGEQRLALEQQSARLLKRYRFLGVQSSAEVKTWMNRSLLMCAPSFLDQRGTCEGLPITILEAQAMQLPVISSIHAGIPEVIIPGETGFLIPEKDWKTLSQYILDLAKSPILRQKFAMAGRKRIEQEFNVKINTAKLECLYDQVLASVP